MSTQTPIFSAIPLAASIEPAVKKWRADGYPGISSVTRRLLEFWFKEEHIRNKGGVFIYWQCQREAIETLIYVYEVCKYRRLYDMVQNFNVSAMVDPSADVWAKYCFKMATGSGKTMVMALAMVWHYFNAKETRDDGVRFTRNFLVLAPNIIVMDRLEEAFGNGAIFRDCPMVPPEWEADFDMQCVMQSADLNQNAEGLIHLTNIQQLYVREKPEPVNPIDALMGGKPMKEEVAAIDALRKRLRALKDLLVINDEAHHVWTDELEWNKVIAELNTETGGITAQLDFTATPKDPSGKFFSHIIYNFPLKSAIEMGFVKKVRIGEIADAPEPLKGDFVSANQVQIDAGIKIHRDHLHDATAIAGKSVLFIICDKTSNADLVGRYLEANGFKGKTLVIHTDTKGNIKKDGLKELRAAARHIDDNDSPYEAIVSVMMLKEGWDVKCVNVIVPLRAFTSPILPEQTLGRGLRRVFKDDLFIEETLIVIDHPRFRYLWEAEIQNGELIADFTKVDNAYVPPNLVQVDPGKMEYDLEFPVLLGGIQRVVPELDQLEVAKLQAGGFEYDKVEVPSVTYREKELGTNKVLREFKLNFDYTENLSVFLGFMSNAIFNKVHCVADHSRLVPKIREYIATRLFERAVNPDDLEVRQKLNRAELRNKILEVISDSVNCLSKGFEEPTLKRSYKLSETPILHTTNDVAIANKCIFDVIPYPKASAFELKFIQWLDNTADVLAFTKIMPQLRLEIPYYDNEGYLRYYTPDFLVKTEAGMFIVETKGLEDVDVKHKDAAAKAWREKASELTGNSWNYIKVKYDFFKANKGQSFALFAASCGV